MSLQASVYKPSTGFVGTAATVVLLWLAAVLLLGDSGAFRSEPQTLPLATLLAIILPPALFFLFLRLPAVRREVLAIDPVWLAAVHGLRILGAGFLFVYAFGHLPGVFAYVAGWGDVVVAVLAPFVVVRLARHPEFLRSAWLWRFHFLGLLDFVAAVGSGLIARGAIPLLGLEQSTAALGEFPLLLIPCFAVPLWICLHLAAFVQIAEARRLR